MKTINRVMACVDFSDYSLETIESALAIGKRRQIEIVLFHVIDSKDLDIVENVSHHLPEKITPEKYVETIEMQRRLIIENMIAEHFEDQRARFTILFQVGIPYQIILAAVASEKIDLVVIASKGRSNLIGTLHGSTAEKVFRHSPVPVLSVRNPEKFRQQRITTEV